jgi:glycosyltransferase involved in cell wall biosynthesis
LKVVIPIVALHVGGGCRALADIANALVKRGHQVEMVVKQGMPVAYKLNCKVTRVPAFTKENIPYGDIVLLNYYYETFLPAFQAWPAQCVRLCQGFEPYWVPDQDFALWTYQQDIPIISISSWLDEQIYHHVGKRGKIVNLGVDNRVFHPAPRKRKANKKTVILYIARDPKAYFMKGYQDFVRAMKLFQRKYRKPFVVNLICTEKPLRLPGIPHKIFQPKTDRQMAHLYRSADVFVSTSWYEGFALPVLEAMACKTAVVTTNSGGILDFCHHGKSGFIVPPRRPRALASALLKVLNNKHLHHKLRIGAYQSALRHTKRKFERDIVRALEEIHQSRRAPQA